jgi:CHAT domain-containing protein
VLADLPRARVAHLATHGFFAAPKTKVRTALFAEEAAFARGVKGRERVGAGARNPLVQTGLVLAGANLPIKDIHRDDGGLLTGEAIAGLPLDGLELVVLSACETGLGELDREGVFGLQRAFHLAGAHNVVASLWKVNDEATAALMKLFYHQLWVEKKPPLEALRAAQLYLYRHPGQVGELARGAPDFFQNLKPLPKETSPPALEAKRAPVKLWAAFVLSGAGRPASPPR